VEVEWAADRWKLSEW